MSDDPLAELESSLKPYRGTLPTHARLPEHGVPRDQVLADLEQMAVAERSRWESGQVSGAVYEGEPEHIELLNRAYALHSQSNPLHLDVWPSAAKLEAEIVSMTAGMLSADRTEDQIVGTVTSGGTESIMLAMRAYCERGRAAGIDRPVMVLPQTAHAAFDKAADAFGIEQRKIPLTDDHVADVDAAAAAIDERTVVVVGSAPNFPHGLVDPIERLSELARERGVGFHTDGCLGGFILPWAERLGHAVPAFDFRLPGVTSISADTHKFGFAAKGTSVVLYRGEELRHHQYFTFTDWPGGLYATPTFAGSRPGGLSAACWAAMVSFGESGYLDSTRRVLATAAVMKDAIRATEGLELIGDPLYVLAFRSVEEGLDVYRVMDEMTDRGWSLNGLQLPPAVHICVTLRHTQPELAERFAADLRQATQAARAQPQGEGGLAPIYGLAASLPDRTLVSGFMEQYMDRWYVP
jgi:glutamate/tyrosine decarboxylase-like PLP-dependent enzyme